MFFVPTDGEHECECDDRDCGRVSMVVKCINLYCPVNPWVSVYYHDCCWACGKNDFDVDD